MDIEASLQIEQENLGDLLIILQSLMFCYAGTHIVCTVINMASSYYILYEINFINMHTSRMKMI